MGTAFPPKRNFIVTPQFATYKILRRRYLGIELDAQYHAAATRQLHLDGIRLSWELYPLKMIPASGPQPPLAVRWRLQ
ncbi:MAG TPA: hypothetical protein VK638_58320 [Edaphobacter sp.]|nr:hypothetical protein [Edaphobacter sp.]